MKTFLIFLSLFFSLYLKAQNPIAFTEEYIDFRITLDYFETNGIYYFENTSSQYQEAYISFPLGVKADSVEVVRVYSLSGNHEIMYSKRDMSIYFTIKIQPKDFLAVNILYRQPVQTENRYILLSTQTWGKPLNIANYSLNVDKDIRIKEFSYSPDSLSQDIYYWRKRNFMPEKDFIVSIE